MRNDQDYINSAVDAVIAEAYRGLLDNLLQFPHNDLSKMHDKFEEKKRRIEEVRGELLRRYAGNNR